jgi:hypothetical protein
LTCWLFIGVPKEGWHVSTKLVRPPEEKMRKRETSTGHPVSGTCNDHV